MIYNVFQFGHKSLKQTETNCENLWSPGNRDAMGP